MLHSCGTISNSRLGDDDALQFVDYLSMNDNMGAPFSLGVYSESAVCMGESWNYGEMAVLWFDTGGNDVIEADAQGARVRELQPNAVICSRLYSRRVPAEQRKYADFESLPDRMLPKRRMTEDSETCMTMRHCTKVL